MELRPCWQTSLLRMKLPRLGGDKHLDNHQPNHGVLLQLRSGVVVHVKPADENKYCLCRRGDCCTSHILTLNHCIHLHCFTLKRYKMTSVVCLFKHFFCLFYFHPPQLTNSSSNFILTHELRCDSKPISRLGVYSPAKERQNGWVLMNLLLLSRCHVAL